MARLIEAGRVQRAELGDRTGALDDNVTRFWTGLDVTPFFTKPLARPLATHGGSPPGAVRAISAFARLRPALSDLAGALGGALVDRIRATLLIQREHRLDALTVSIL